MVIQIPIFSIPKPSEIYPDWDFWFDKNHLATLAMILLEKKWPRCFRRMSLKRRKSWRETWSATGDPRPDPGKIELYIFTTSPSWAGLPDCMYIYLQTKNTNSSISSHLQSTMSRAQSRHLTSIYIPKGMFTTKIEHPNKFDILMNVRQFDGSAIYKSVRQYEG
jgi:hypothetical protein